LWVCDPDSSERLEVRLHDTCDSIDFRKPPKGSQPLGVKAAVVAQRLDSHIQADLVSELEAIGDRFRGAIDAKRDPGDIVLFHAFSKACAGHMDEAEPGASLSWPPGLAVDGYPHLGRVLGREAVEAKRSQKAEDPSGDAATGFRQTVPLSQDRAREGVEAPSDAFDHPSFAQPPKLRARHSPMLELARACDSDLSQELDCTIAGRQLCHNTSVIDYKYRDFVTRSGRRCKSVRREMHLAITTVPVVEGRERPYEDEMDENGLRLFMY
jgi:hypothetical protein